MVLTFRESAVSVSFSRPQPPYYAVVISTVPSREDPEGYEAMDARMAELGEAQPGYLGGESLAGPGGHAP